MDEIADSICRTEVRLLRFSAPILLMGCSTSGFSLARRHSAAGALRVPARELRRSVYPSDVVERLVLVAGVVLAPGRRTVTAALRSWGAIVIPPFALSIVSSTGRHGHPGPRRAAC